MSPLVSDAKRGAAYTGRVVRATLIGTLPPAAAAPAAANANRAVRCVDVVRSRADRTPCHGRARVPGAAPHMARRLRRVQRDAGRVGVAGGVCALAACACGNSRRRACPRVALAQWFEAGLTVPTTPALLAECTPRRPCRNVRTRSTTRRAIVCVLGSPPPGPSGRRMASGENAASGPSLPGLAQRKQAKPESMGA